MLARADYISAARADYISAARADYISAARADYNSAARADYISAVKPVPTVSSNSKLCLQAEDESFDTNVPDEFPAFFNIQFVIIEHKLY